MREVKSIFYENYINGEYDVVTYTKVKGRLVLSGLLLLIGLFILLFAVSEIVENIISKKIDFKLMSYYVSCGFVAFTLLFPVEFLFSYFYNKLVITNTHAIIRRGAFGKVYIIPKSLILAKSVVCTGFIGTTDYQILIFLKNGKKICTGRLYCKGEDFESINNKLDFREISTKKEIKKDFSKSVTDRVTIKTNIILPIFTFLPLIMIILIIILLSFGFNSNYGEQKSFEIYGTVIEKQIKTSDENTDMELVILDSGTNETHEVDVNRDVFEIFSKNQKIIIKGKRGSLGLLYDIRFYHINNNNR